MYRFFRRLVSRVTPYLYMLCMKDAKVIYVIYVICMPSLCNEHRRLQNLNVTRTQSICFMSLKYTFDTIRD